ncbi:MAG: hypothetical protein CL398_11245 [Acidiferrobacteraceae bacterium]|nr:hypothetical protein [Acidiferrobacteraceae bacterium]
MNPVINLNGASVLVTRPEHQSASLCELIDACGGRPIRCPTLIIEAPDDETVAKQNIRNIQNADIVIFLSVNAVAYGINLLQRCGQTLRSEAKIFAIGPGTAFKLREAGIKVSGVATPPFKSENLLAIPELAAPVRKVVYIFSGEHGRAWLTMRLVERNANVVAVTCYRRSAPSQLNASALRYLEQYGISVVTLMSVSAAQNLWNLMSEGKRLWLKEAPLVVVSARVEQHCRVIGYQGKIIVATCPTEESILEGVYTVVSDL